MTKLIAALALTVTLGAQTVDPREQTYGPFEPAPRDRSFSVAVAAHGMLLAWSEVDPGETQALIHIALLDHDAQLAGPIRVLTVNHAGAQATAPLVATDGERFFVAWTERDPFSYAPRPAGLEAIRVRDGVAGTPFRLNHSMGEEPSSPSVAGSLAVFEDDGVVYGSFIEGDTFLPPFVIAVTGRLDAPPRAHSLGSRYLITYTINQNWKQSTLIGRFVTP